MSFAISLYNFEKKNYSLVSEYFNKHKQKEIIIELSLSNLRIGALTFELFKFHKVRYLKRQCS